jgi:hypothetical protein
VSLNYENDSNSIRFCFQSDLFHFNNTISFNSDFSNDPTFLFVAPFSLLKQKKKNKKQKTHIPCYQVSESKKAFSKIIFSDFKTSAESVLIKRDRF